MLPVNRSRSGPGIETALMSVQNYILRAMDSQHVVILVMFDLTAAFDNVNHEVLLERLSGNIGISRVASQWCRSYLTDRQQFVRVQSDTSTSVRLTLGIPQGSVLGPLLFSVYPARGIDLFNHIVHIVSLMLMTPTLLL